MVKIFELKKLEARSLSYLKRILNLLSPVLRYTYIDIAYTFSLLSFFFRKGSGSEKSQIANSKKYMYYIIKGNKDHFLFFVLSPW